MVEKLIEDIELAFVSTPEEKKNKYIQRLQRLEKKQTEYEEKNKYFPQVYEQKIEEVKKEIEELKNNIQ